MTVFDASLDLRGRTVRLRGPIEHVAGGGFVVTIPEVCKRTLCSAWVSYYWYQEGGKRVYQNTKDDAVSTSYDIIRVLPEPAENGGAPAEESLHPNGRTIMPGDCRHTYLGDGAYASVSRDGSGGVLAVKANDHLDPTDTVYLGPNELAALIRFARLHGFLPEQNDEAKS